MSECLHIPYDIFIEKPVTEVKTEYHMYAMQEDGWFGPDEKYLKEMALASEWGPYSDEAEAEEKFNSYLSQKDREAFIIKRTIITVIDPDGPMIRNVQMTETIIKKGSSKETT
jgi:hypothetical protein